MYNNKIHLKYLIDDECKSFGQIAKKYGVAKSTISYWAKKFGLYSSQSPIINNDSIEYEELKVLVAEGLSLKEIASKLHRTHSIVTYSLKFYDLEIQMRKESLCLNCSKSLTYRQKKYCSNSCQSEFQYKDYVSKWLCGIEDGSKGGDMDVSRYIHRYLIEKCEGSCAVCGLREWMGEPIPLNLDHIDGNSSNHNINNLRMVCGNCDMLLPTYKNKNNGNGRFSRRKRYKEGKSY